MTLSTIVFLLFGILIIYFIGFRQNHQNIIPHDEYHTAKLPNNTTKNKNSSNAPNPFNYYTNDKYDQYEIY